MAAAIRLSQQHSCSFDHLVGALLEKQRYFDAKCLGGLEVDHQFEFGRRLNGKVARLLAPYDAIEIGGGASKYVAGVRSVREQPAISSHDGVPIDRRYLVSSRLQNHWSPMNQREAVGHCDETAALLTSSMATIAWISASLRTGAAIASNLNDRAAVSKEGRYDDPRPGAVSGLNMIATRLTVGAISVSNSSNLPANSPSVWTKPVILPPGWDRPATKPSPTGSETTTNTIGTVRVSR